MRKGITIHVMKKIIKEHTSIFPSLLCSFLLFLKFTLGSLDQRVEDGVTAQDAAILPEMAVKPYDVVNGLWRCVSSRFIFLRLGRHVAPWATSGKSKLWRKLNHDVKDTFTSVRKGRFAVERLLVDHSVHHPCAKRHQHVLLWAERPCYFVVRSGLVQRRRSASRTCGHKGPCFFCSSYFSFWTESEIENLQHFVAVFGSGVKRLREN